MFDKTTQINDLYKTLIKSSSNFTPDDNSEFIQQVKLFNIATLPRLKFNNNDDELGVEVTYFILNLFIKNKKREERVNIREVLNLFNKDSLSKLTKEIYKLWAFDSKTKWVFPFIAMSADHELIKGIGDIFVLMGENKKFVLIRELLEYFDCFTNLSIVKELEIIILKDRTAMISGNAINIIHRIERKYKKSRNQLIDPYIKNNIYDLKFQKQRLRSILYVPHYWKFKNWKDHFINKDYINKKKFSQNLIWGIYDKCNNKKRLKVDSSNEYKLIQSFRYDNKNFIDKDDKILNLKDEDIITLLHPVELNKYEFNDWKTHFQEKKLKQPIKQLELGRFYPKNDEDQCFPSTGVIIKRGILRKKILKRGWNHGYSLEKTAYNTYIKHLDNYLKAEIKFDGDNLIANILDDNEEISLQALSIYTKKEDNSFTSTQFNKIPLRLYSSLVNDIKKVLKNGKKMFNK